MATRKRAAKTRTSAKKKATTRATARRGKRVAAPQVEYEGYSSDGEASGPTLVIVESPAKAKTIGKYLGRGYRVRATVGHIMDLP